LLHVHDVPTTLTAVAQMATPAAARGVQDDGAGLWPKETTQVFAPDATPL
jgi:hypothetical protein